MSKSKIAHAIQLARWADPGWRATTIPVAGSTDKTVVMSTVDRYTGKTMYGRVLAQVANEAYAQRISKTVNDFLNGKSILGVEPLADTKYMYSRDNTKTGVILDLHCMPCRLEGCTGERIHVQWEDGKHTYPCSKGCIQLDEHHWRIM